MSNKGVWNKVTVECMVSLNNNNGKKKKNERKRNEVYYQHPTNQDKVADQ